tara:strand:- start:4743 stop:5261 length:519 start_codon:yes stop_codon:yes gene_type:complete
MDTWLGACICKAANDVHVELGGGLSESMYKNALAIALRARGLIAETEMPIPVSFAGEYVGFIRPDIVVNKQVVLELKAVSKITEVHLVQLGTYLRWIPPPSVDTLRVVSTVRGAVINFSAVDVEVKTVIFPTPTLQQQSKRHRPPTDENAGVEVAEADPDETSRKQQKTEVQ